MELCHQLLLKMDLKPFLVHVINIGVTNFAAADNVNVMERYLLQQPAKRPHRQSETDEAASTAPSREDTASPLSVLGDSSLADDAYVCGVCGETFPPFFAEPHRLFHEAEASEAPP
jgi:hypothetical protein